MDRYSPIRRLGQGGFGAVYLVRDIRLDRELALKLLHAPENEEVRTRFLREGKAMAALKHPGIVELFDFGVEGEVPYMAMALVEGASLQRPPRNLDVVAAMMQAAEALQAAHDSGILHRDVKPENLLWDGERVLLTDFGLSHDVDATRLTRVGASVGTLPYMSPEVLRGGEPVAATDWWAWGVTLYHLLERHLPWQEDVILAALRERRRFELPPFERADPDGPGARLVEACLRWDPEDRPRGVSDLRRIADEAVHGSGAGRAGATSSRATGEPGRRRRRGAMVLAFALGLGLAWWNRGPARAPPSSLATATPTAGAPATTAWPAESTEELAAETQELVRIQEKGGSSRPFPVFPQTTQAWLRRAPTMAEVLERLVSPGVAEGLDEATRVRLRAIDREYIRHGSLALLGTLAEPAGAGGWVAEALRARAAAERESARLFASLIGEGDGAPPPPALRLRYSLKRPKSLLDAVEHLEDHPLDLQDAQAWLGEGARETHRMVVAAMRAIARGTEEPSELARGARRGLEEQRSFLFTPLCRLPLEVFLGVHPRGEAGWALAAGAVRRRIGVAVELDLGPSLLEGPAWVYRGARHEGHLAAVEEDLLEALDDIADEARRRKDGRTAAAFASVTPILREAQDQRLAQEILGSLVRALARDPDAARPELIREVLELADFGRYLDREGWADEALEAAAVLQFHTR
jgi:hypothetical protein